MVGPYHPGKKMEEAGNLRAVIPGGRQRAFSLSINIKPGLSYDEPFPWLLEYYTMDGKMRAGPLSEDG